MFLIDAAFRKEPPLCILQQGTRDQLLPGWEMIASDQNSTLFVKGNLAITVIRSYVERGKGLAEDIQYYIKDLLLNGGAVLLGCYAQPYYINEDNYVILELLDSLRNDTDLQRERARGTQEVGEGRAVVQTYLDNMAVWMLGDYATTKHGTLVWLLDGGPFDQDLALMKVSIYLALVMGLLILRVI